MLLKGSKKICFFSGAGMSTESGLPDFRSTYGLWRNNERFEYLISKDYFDHQPIEFWKSYKEIFAVKMLNNYEPNKGHTFITNLQDSGKQITVITQNIDGLHTKSGTKNVFEVHGTLNTATCPKCYKQYDLAYIIENDIPRCNNCNRNGIPCHMILKPDVVLYGDPIHKFNEALEAAYESDLFIVMGSSLTVAPINTIPQYLARTTTPMILINKERTILDDLFDIVIYDRIGITIDQLTALL